MWFIFQNLHKVTVSMFSKTRWKYKLWNKNIAFLAILDKLINLSELLFSHGDPGT